MKKVLVLSALGCVATVGAVFAAFTLDPTSESQEIPSVNVDVDLSSHVFSTFTRVTEIDYKASDGKIYEAVQIGEPQYHFKPKNVFDEGGFITGTTLDLHCDDYDINDMSLYCTKRESEPEKKDTPEHEQWEKELAELAPTGYAFKYEYDSDFIKRISVDDRYPADDMQPWEYAIYKTTFSSGLTQSDFKATKEDKETQGLDDFGIIYQNPDATNPNYKEFEWKKNDFTRDSTGNYPWITGNPVIDPEEDPNPGFYIQPEVTKEGAVLNKGVVFFTGAEITENLFAGQFPDETAVKDCEAYLKTHKNFALKIKASEYFKVDNHDLRRADTTRFEFINRRPDIDFMTSGDRYSFNFIIDESIAQMFKDGFEIDKLAIYDDGNNAIRLISEEALKSGDSSALGLKVTLENSIDGVTDITRFFKYGIEDDEYRDTIYFDNTVTTNGGISPKVGDIIKIYFVFRKNNGGIIEKSSWFKAQLDLVKPVKETYDLEDAGGTGTYSWSSGEPVSLLTDKIYRFEALADMDKYFVDFSLTSDGAELVELTSEIAKPYILDKEGRLMELDSELYEFNEGVLTFHDKEIRQRYGFGEGCKYAVDVRNADAATTLAVKTASLTTAPIPRNYIFNEYIPGAKDLETGYFKMDPSHYQTIKNGMILNFRCNLDNQDSGFWKSIKALADDTEGYNAKITFTLLDDTGNPIPLTSGTLDFTVQRVYKDESKQPMDDTSKYTYDPATYSISTTDQTYIKGLKLEDGYHQLVFSVNYAGAQKTIGLNTAVTLEITK